jgi:hypothetical protein
LEVELSTFYLALKIKAAYEGMMIAPPSSAWKRYEKLDASALADPRRLPKHKRGPKTPKKPSYVSGAEERRHVSTAQLLTDDRAI